MIATLALAALAAMPTDTPTDEIPRTIVEAVVATPEGVEMCETYRTIRGALDALVVGADLDATQAAMFVDMVDGYLLLRVEQDALRLTPEARDFLFDHWHVNCV